MASSEREAILLIGSMRGSDEQLWTCLRDLARGEDVGSVLARLVETAPERLAASAVAQGMTSAVVAVLGSLDAPIPAELARTEANARFVRAAAIDVLTAVDSVLEDADVPWVALKGSVLAARYADPELRPFNDVDILVAGRNLSRAIDALATIGFRDVNRNWGNYLAHGVAETPLWGPGLAIDLHWHVIALETSRRRTSIDTDAMIGRRRRVALGSTDTWTLDAVDFLIHVCIHAGKSGATRLLWLRDIRELVASEPPDWDLLVDRTRQTGTSAIVGQVLDRARVIVGADVPLEVPHMLCPLPMLRTRRGIDRLERGAGLPHRFVRGFPVAVSAGSWAAMARQVASVLAERMGPHTGWDVGDPTGPLYWNTPSGDARARGSYLAYAERYATTIDRGHRGRLRAKPGDDGDEGSGAHEM